MGLDHKVLGNLLTSILEFYKAEPRLGIFSNSEKTMHQIKIIQLKEFSVLEFLKLFTRGLMTYL